MNPTSTPVGEDSGAQQPGQSAPPQQGATTASALDLRGTLLEAHDTVLMVEGALRPTTDTGDAQGAKSSKASEIKTSCGKEEPLIQQCIEIIRCEHNASVSYLQGRLRLGYGHIMNIMDELERRRIVGPSKGAEPRDILADAQGGLPDDQDSEDPYEAFFQACLAGNPAKARDLLAAGLDVNYQSGGATALHMAASSGHEAIVRLLLDAGASVDSRLGTVQGPLGPELAGATPLILAIASNRRSVAELLLSRGANPRARTHKGFTGEMLGRATGRMELSF